MQRNGLDSEKRNKGMVKLCLDEFDFFVETMAKSPQISGKNLCKWDDRYLPTQGKEFPKEDGHSGPNG